MLKQRVDEPIPASGPPVLRDTALPPPPPPDDDGKLEPWHKLRSNSSSTGNVPRYGDHINPTSVRGMFKSSITNPDRMYAFTRDELVNKCITKYSDACLNKWLTLELVGDGDTEENKSFISALNSLFDDINLQLKLGMAFKIGLVLGVGYLGLAYSSTPSDNRLPPARAGELMYVTPITPENCAIETRDTNPKSRTYGEPLTYKVKNDITRSNDIIHASRIIPIVPFPWDDNSMGMNLIDHNFDKILSKKSMDWSMAEACYRHVIPFLEVVTPDDPDTLDWAYTNFGNGMVGKNVAIHMKEDEAWDFILHTPQHPLNPEPYYKNVIDLLAAGLFVPRTHALGTGEGSISGSETNTVSFFSDISAKQNTVLTPVVRELIKRVVPLGVLAKYGWTKTSIPTYIIKWNPAFELTGKELAQEKLMTARALTLLVEKGILTENEARIELGYKPLSDAELEKMKPAPPMAAPEPDDEDDKDDDEKEKDKKTGGDDDE